MGKTNIISVLVTSIMFFVVGYIWYGSTLFGDVVTGSGLSVDFLKFDLVTLLLIVLTGYGLVHVFHGLVKMTGTKDVGGALKLGLTFGGLGIGLPVVTLLTLLGFGKMLLLVVFCHLVLVTILTSLIVIKLKKV